MNDVKIQNNEYSNINLFASKASWKNASPSQRKEAIIELENHQAQLAGREACEIKFIPAGNDHYCPDDGIIYFNESILTNTNNASAYFIVVHERDHATEDQERKDQTKRRDFVINNEKYKKSFGIC